MIYIEDDALLLKVMYNNSQNLKKRLYFINNIIFQLIENSFWSKIINILHKITYFYYLIIYFSSNKNSLRSTRSEKKYQVR